jgi:alpha-tubulin suppressor-like RCC1 family protein
MLANETVAVAFERKDAPEYCNIWQFSNLDDVEHWYVRGDDRSVRERYQIKGSCAALVGGSTAFALLTRDGNIYTWGLEHRIWELGRMPTDSFLAGVPGPVDYLAGLKVKKIVAHQDLYGAITEYDDLYVWGSLSAELSTRVRLDLSQSLVNLVDIGDDVNIIDVGIGAGFLVGVSDGGQIYAIGCNKNGQLLLKESQETVADWQRIVDLNAYRVVCGHWTTFVISR